MLSRQCMLLFLKEGVDGMMSRISRRSLALFLCILITLFAMPAMAATYSKVYGQTKDKLRVRESASTSAAVIDNILKNSCVYITTSKNSGHNTFVQVRYRAKEGDIVSGWLCQTDGDDTYVKVLSATQAKSLFGVENGNLPNKKVGTYTAKERAAAKGSASANTSSSSPNVTAAESATIKDVQTKLKALGFYSGDITGNAGTKTVNAIKAFQKKYNLTADGVAGAKTVTKINEVYKASGKSSSSSSSSSSEEATIKDAQSKLKALGFYSGEITGNAGTKTVEAIKAFQKKYDLSVDGVLGKATVSKLNSVYAGSSKSTGSTSLGTSTLSLNSQGAKVKVLQQNLATLGYYSAEVTGHYGEKTEAAVRKFQKDNNMSVDGVAGSKTLTAISKAVSAKGTGSGSSSSSSSSSSLKLGSTGSAVKKLQENLTALGYYYGDITGHFGSMTETSVKKFQKVKGLTQTGVADKSTQNAISKAMGGSTSSSSGSSSSSSSSGTSLREGDSGSGVTELQKRLTTLGYYYGDITGHYGSLTTKAVKYFQDNNDLTVDGIAGVATLRKLYSMTGGGTVNTSTTSSSSSSSSSGSTTTTNITSYGRVTKNNVYLREKANVSSKSKTSLDSGTLLKITKKATTGNETWYYASASKGGYRYTGYIRSDMLTIISYADYKASTGTADDEEVEGLIRVTSSGVVLRAGPGTSYDKVGTANKGDMFYYVDYSNGWYRLTKNKYIMGQYAARVSDSDASSYSQDSGSSSSMVSWIQESLKTLKYYSAEVTGHFGNKTEDAVRSFQSDHGLTADGVVGKKTLAAIQSALNGSSGSSGSSSSSTSVSVGSTVYNLDWFKAKNNGIFSQIGFVRGREAKLTDLTTGKSLNIHIQSAGNHLDVEPLTASDTRTLCSIYGVSSASYISYVRRPMLITTSQGYQIVCSIYGTPHGAQDITNNNYPGQFCLHFLNSKTHNSDKVDSDHMAAIQKAVEMIGSSKVKKLTSL